MQFRILLFAAIAVATAAKADEPQTMADILPPHACQPCHETVPKLKLLPRDVKTLFKDRPVMSGDDLMKMLRGQSPPPPPLAPSVDK